MALSHIPLDAITEQHLRDLIQTGARESLHIDYKRQTYGKKDADRREFLADICSFANAVGGDIVIGMAEKEGVPSEITPFADNADEERLRLEQMARDGIEPRIIGLAVRVVTVSGGVVFIVRVPKSWNPPHRVKFQGSNRFYARSSGGRYEPDIGELRNLFLAAPHIAKRIRAFRMERIARIAAGETPVALSGDTPGRAVLHVVPYSAFGGANPAWIKRCVEGENWQRFAPFGRNYATLHRVNFDGFVALSNFDALVAQLYNEHDPSKHSSYCQVFRHGAVETVAIRLYEPTDASFNELGSMLYNSVYTLTNALAHCDVAPPYVVMFSLLNTARSYSRAPTALQTAYQDQYHFTEAQFDTVPESREAAKQALIPLLDHVASLSGAISSGIEPKPTSP